MIRVLVTAASAVVRAGLEALISGRPGLEVVGTASGPETLSQQIEALDPDVVLMELERGAERAVGQLRAVDGTASPALIMLTESVDGTDVQEALSLGARGVLPRSAPSEEILGAVEAAAAGLVVLHADTVESLLPLFSQTRRAAPPQQEALTHREVEVLRMLAEGAGNKTIARRLNISEHTVKFHVGSIMAKLNASSRTEAVTLGIRQGLIMV